MRTSTNGMSACLIASQARSDHEEYALLPMTSVYCIVQRSARAGAARMIAICAVARAWRLIAQICGHDRLDRLRHDAERKRLAAEVVDFHRIVVVARQELDRQQFHRERLQVGQ